MGNHASSHANTCSATILDMKVLEEHTHLTKEEIRETFSKFRDASKGGDSINRRKFSDIMHQCFPRTHKTELEDYVFKLYDIDSNGVIEFEEFLIICNLMREGTTHSKLSDRFSLFNKNTLKIFYTACSMIFLNSRVSAKALQLRGSPDFSQMKREFSDSAFQAVQF